MNSIIALISAILAKLAAQAAYHSYSPFLLLSPHE